ncbi:MAG: citrate/2-methylcitrate synthase [Streptococcaceae bacterium]|jgi:citrate synthase|nr:citrate/2-methylcitrate synthase [Streptococcaceae bacterium]
MKDNVAKLSEKLLANTTINTKLYKEYDVKKGLRDIDGKGVLAGLTNISLIKSMEERDGKRIPIDGVLHYRGIDIRNLVHGFQSGGYFGFEEICYLLLFGELPNEDELSDFRELLAEKRTLPKNYIRDVLMKSPTKDLMNHLSRSVLTLASYDPHVDDLSIPNVLEQCLSLISIFPLLSVYSYHSFAHRILDKSFYIHKPKAHYSTAENILRLLRPDKSFSKIEATILDLALVLHMEHGGGNNSTFTTHVVTSSGTDTYAAVSAALASLKGPKHGGANIKVTEMMKNIKENVEDITNDDQVADYLKRILNKDGFDKKGLIYGMGHAVYSVSDPRADLFSQCVKQLAEDRGLHDEFQFYKRVERLAPQVIAKERNVYKGVSANIDFYSGFVYHMLDLPDELYTPLFAVARIVGWSAHRMEELINMNKIIRPAYESISSPKHYRPIQERG